MASIKDDSIMLDEKPFTIIDFNVLQSTKVSRIKTEHCYIIYCHNDYCELINNLNNFQSRYKIKKTFQKYGAMFLWQAKGKEKYQFSEDGVFMFTDLEQAKLCLYDYIIPLYMALKIKG